MTASMALLLVLQVLWLTNSYEKALFDLRRETNTLFRSTLSTVRDSLFAKNIQPSSLDSLVKPESIQSVYVTRDNRKDTTRINYQASSVQVFVNSATANDSIIRALKPMARHFNRPMAEGKSFIIRLEPDSISLDSLKGIFSNALLESGYSSLQLNVHHEKPLPRFTPFMKTNEANKQPGQKKELKLLRDTLMLDPVMFNPLHEYQASLTGFRVFLLKEIFPQIVFSFFLTVITGAAFFMLYKNLRAQQRLTEIKNDFISNVTHELKTPVATVSVALEALKNFNALNNPTLTREYLDIAQNELNRLTLMTDKILKTAVFESNGLVIDIENINLDHIITQIIDSMKLVFEKHHAQVSFTKTGNNYTLNGSKTHLTNVIYNLVDNALKYSPENPVINISLSEKPTDIIITVNDNGLGIPNEFKKKVFEKFFRVPTGDIHRIKGYGLGLSYVASVVKSHHGNIELESTPGKGSTFTIILPKQSD